MSRAVFGPSRTPVPTTIYAMPALFLDDEVVAGGVFVADVEAEIAIFVGGGQLAGVEAFGIDTPDLHVFTVVGADADVGLDDLGHNGGLTDVDHLFTVELGIGIAGSADGGKEHIIGLFDGVIG